MGEIRGRRRVLHAVVLLLIAMTAGARVLRAQRVSGTVRDSASQLPLPGAVVLLLDPSGKAAARSTTDQLGHFKLFPPARRTPARLRVRVLRMGFRPHELALGDPVAAIEISLVSFPIVLDELHVSVPPSCPKRPDRAGALAVLQQVRTALYATVLARSQNAATMTRLLYARHFDGESDRVASQTVRTRATSGTDERFTPARSAAAFNRLGFVEDTTGSHTYLGPDAGNLIDEQFAESYCFQFMSPDAARPLQVGLHFEPAERADDDADNRIDMRGTLWVDTVSRTLKDLTFRYVGLDRETSALVPQGRLSFRELPNGVVIVDQWSLRLLGQRGDASGVNRVRSGDVLATGASRPRAQEIGGEIARAGWPDGYSWRAPLGSVRLHVVDREGHPAASSRVVLLDTDVQGTTDASGMVELNDLLPGPYVASVRDPRLAALNLPLASATRFTVARDSLIEARILVESAESVLGRRCGQEPFAAGKGWLLARVVGADGRPVSDARFTIRDEFGSPMAEGGRVDTDGMFQWCQLPLNRRVTIEVWRDDRRVTATQFGTERLITMRFELPR